MPKLKRLTLGQRTVTSTADALSDIEGQQPKATVCSIYVDKDGNAQEICHSDATLNTGLMIQPLAEQHLSLANDIQPIINAVTTSKPIADDYSSWVHKSAREQANTVTERTIISESQTITEKENIAREVRTANEVKASVTPSPIEPSQPILQKQEAVSPQKPVEPVAQQEPKKTEEPAKPAPVAQPAQKDSPSQQAQEKKADVPAQSPAVQSPPPAQPAAPAANVIVAKPTVLTPEQMLEQEMTKLIEAEKKLGSDLPTLHELYLKGIIDKDSYEKSKTAIDARYSELEQKLKSVNEKSHLEQLKKRITQEIESTLMTPQFEETNRQLLAEAAKLDELFNDGVIDKKIYDDKKALIQQKLNRIKNLESKIIGAFDAYVQEFAKKQEQEEVEKKQLLDRLDQEIEESVKPKPAPVPQKPAEQIQTKPLPSVLAKNPRLLTLVNKVGLFKTATTAQETTAPEGLHEEIQKIEVIRKKQNDEFALINTVLLVKRQLLQRLGIQKEMTYSEVLDMLPRTAIDHDIRERLSVFFNKYLERQYIGAMSESDFNDIWTEGNKLLTLLKERVKPVIVETKKK